MSNGTSAADAASGQRRESRIRLEEILVNDTRTFIEAGSVIEGWRLDRLVATVAKIVPDVENSSATLVYRLVLSNSSWRLVVIP
jgi:hypothetical protein